MSPWLLILFATVGLTGAFALVFLLARRIDNYGIVDVAWSYAFAGLAACAEQYRERIDTR